MRLPFVADRAEVQLTSECNIVERTLDHLKKDMQTVVATVTGYDGLERSKLIMLINKTGAAYTGKWTPGHTHLVSCRPEILFNDQKQCI